MHEDRLCVGGLGLCYGGQPFLVDPGQKDMSVIQGTYRIKPHV